MMYLPVALGRRPTLSRPNGCGLRGDLETSRFSLRILHLGRQFKGHLIRLRSALAVATVITIAATHDAAGVLTRGACTRRFAKFGAIGKRRHMSVEWFADRSSAADDDHAPRSPVWAGPLPALILLCAAHRFLFASF
jgi:hypothetical protein